MGIASVFYIYMYIKSRFTLVQDTFFKLKKAGALGCFLLQI